MNSITSILEEPTAAGLPLRGVRILDLSSIVAGPYCTHVLKALGADVIKVERPRVGDGLRDLPMQAHQNGLSAAFVGCNAGKRSIALDITKSEGKKVLEKLIREVDILVEGFRPGELERHGFGKEHIKSLNPEIITCSISAWGQEGPLAKRGGYDPVMQAATGILHLQGHNENDPPLKVGFPLIDIVSGMQATIAILAAIMRKRSRESGSIDVDVSMADACLIALSPLAHRYLNAGQVPKRSGNAGFTASPGSNVYPTANGWLSTTANTLGQFDAMCKILGRPEFAHPPYIVMRPDSPNAMLRGLGTPEMYGHISEALKGNSAEEWERLLNEVDVPSSTVRSLQDFLENIYPKTPGISTQIDEPRLGPGVKQHVIGAGFRWTGQNPLVAQQAPMLGEHSSEILAEMGFSLEQIEELRRSNIVY